MWPDFEDYSGRSQSNHAHDRPTPTCLGAQSRVRHKLNSQFAPEKPAEIGSKMPKALIVDGIHPKSCRCHAPLLFTGGN